MNPAPSKYSKFLKIWEVWGMNKEEGAG